ncbi:hypothetical protein [Kitasatospora sp. NPDC059571]|uniref:hypothetical protein n=1 Tax=Kitasatospora sp. NPDC059571 TaxID=3346871 RepID=UPI0036BF81B3
MIEDVPAPAAAEARSMRRAVSDDELSRILHGIIGEVDAGAGQDGDGESGRVAAARCRAGMHYPD